MTRRQQILEALRTRAEAISVGNGFDTNAGATLFLGVIPSLGEGDPGAALAMIPRTDIIDVNSTDKMPIELPVDFIAIAKPSLDEPWVAIEQLLGDVKKAIELDDRTLGGLLRGGRNKSGMYRGTTDTLERRSGEEMVGALITYVCPYSECWGEPDA